MILVKNDSELGEFIFFQQTICCAFACNNLFLKDTWYMSWGRIWPITKTFGRLLSYGNSWVARLSKNRQNVIHYPELAMKTWKVWSHPTTMTEMVQPSGKLRVRSTLDPIFAFFGSKSFGGSSLMQEGTVLHQKNSLEWDHSRENLPENLNFKILRVSKATAPWRVWRDTIRFWG